MNLTDIVEHKTPTGLFDPGQAVEEAPEIPGLVMFAAGRLILDRTRALKAPLISLFSFLLAVMKSVAVTLAGCCT